MIVTSKALDETDKKIVDQIKNGMSYKRIAQKLYLSIPTIKYRIKVMKQAYKCKTLPSLMSKLKD